jgi:hypothetical protein
MWVGNQLRSVVVTVILTRPMFGKSFAARLPISECQRSGLFAKDIVITLVEVSI